MNQIELDRLKADFLNWSGGFEPESGYQIVVYADYARDSRLGRDEVVRALEDWILGGLENRPRLTVE